MMIEFDCSDENIKRTIEKDYFKRNAYILNLIDYVKDSVEFNTYAINGELGSGKTVFIYQFMYVVKHHELLAGDDFKDINQDDMLVYYYNAWEKELIKKPSMAILSSIINEICGIDQNEREFYTDCINKLSNVVIKLSTAGLFNANDFLPSKDDEISVDKIKKTFEETINKIVKRRKCKKVVIIIDELDRCKPTNVVQLLEEIKHFYSGNNLCIILSSDLKQLGCTIKKLYGEHFDSDLYLQRFFDAIFTINRASYEKYINEELKFNISSNSIVNESCKVAISYNSLTVRETNKFIKKMKVIAQKLQNFPPNEKDLSVAKLLFVPWGLALKYRGNDNYDVFMNGSLNKSKIEEYLYYSKEIPKWISEYYYDRNDIPNDFNITEKVYSLYRSYFKGKDFIYHGDDYNSLNFRKQIIPYIEF